MKQNGMTPPLAIANPDNKNEENEKPKDQQD